MRKIILLTFTLFCFSFAQAASIKEPNVAGSFYDSDPKKLSEQIDSFIKQAAIETSDKKIQAIVVPHAGYMYSGAIAAYGYKVASKMKLSTVVVLAPSHFAAFEGASVWPDGGFKTPLGVLEVDTDFSKKLLQADDQLKVSLEAYQQEHSLEVQLPFIQKVFGNVKIVPILMGNPNPKFCKKLAEVLNELISSREDVLVIASSDMSHYLDYDTANKMDEVSLEAINLLDPEKFWKGNLWHQMEMCGFVPVTTLILYAKERGLKVQVLKHANSGDTAGDKTKVVGYSSIVFYQDKIDMNLTKEEKKQLQTLARETLHSFVNSAKIPDLQTNDARLLQTQGVFVTLRKEGQLRGCIGSLMGDKSLWLSVRDMTVAAASKDSRFSPITKEELSNIDIEISILSVPQRIAGASEIVLGRDGVIISDGFMHQGVFLPQVATETNWSKEKFLSELCSQKAGLAADCWKNSQMSMFTFQAEVF